MKRMPRLAICGPGRSGKDVAATIFSQVLGIKYRRSTSEAATQVVWEQWGQHPRPLPLTNAEAPESATPRYDSPESMFADRMNHREIWAEIINTYNQPDGLKLYRDMVAEGEMVLCGIRRSAELRACQSTGLVDLCIWIDRPNCQDVTCEVTIGHCDVSVPNHGNKEQFEAKLTRLAHCLL